jgi:hypothetical protein
MATGDKSSTPEWITDASAAAAAGATVADYLEDMDEFFNGVSDSIRELSAQPLPSLRILRLPPPPPTLPPQSPVTFAIPFNFADECPVEPNVPPPSSIPLINMLRQSDREVHYLYQASDFPKRRYMVGIPTILNGVKPQPVQTIPAELRVKLADKRLIKRSIGELKSPRSPLVDRPAAYGSVAEFKHRHQYIADDISDSEMDALLIELFTRNTE